MAAEKTEEFQAITLARNETQPDLVLKWEEMKCEPVRKGKDFFSVYHMSEKLGERPVLLVT